MEQELETKTQDPKVENPTIPDEASELEPLKEKDPNAFDYYGTTLNKNHIVHVLNRNLIPYMDHLGWNDKLRAAFQLLVGLIADGIAKGTITLNTDGSIHDSTGVLQNSTDKFQSSQRAVNYLHEAMESITPVSKKNDPNTKPEPFTNYSLKTLLGFFDNFYGGNTDLSESDWNLWYDRDKKDKDGKREVTNRLIAMSDVIRNAANEHTDEKYKLSLTVLADALGQGKWDAPTKLAWVSAGLPMSLADRFFYDGTQEMQAAQQAAKEKAEAEKANDPHNQFIALAKQLYPGITDALIETLWKLQQATTQASILATVNAAAADLEKLEKEAAWKTHYNTNYANAPFTLQTHDLNKMSKNWDTQSVVQRWDEFSQANRENWLRWYENQLKYPEGWSRFSDSDSNNYGTWLRFMLWQDSLRADEGKSSNMVKSSVPGVYILKTAVNRGGKGVVWAYNRNTKQVYKIKVTPNTPIALQVLREEWENSLPKSKLLKEGGIIKALNGASLAILESTNQRIKANKAKLDAEIKASGKTKELYLHDSKELKSMSDLSNSDWIRIGAVAADFTTSLAAFIPGYGTAVSTIGGLAATVAEAGADIADGAGLGTVVKNFGVGLGLTAMGIIPGAGTASKAAKAAKLILRYGPALATTGINAGPALAAAKKLNSGEKFTVADMKAMCDFLTGVSGLNRTGSASRKASIMKNAAKLRITQKTTISTKQGDVEVTPQLLQTLTQATSKTEMQAKFNSMFANTEHAGKTLDFGFFNGTKPAGANFWNRGVSINTSEKPIYNFDVLLRGNYDRKIKGFSSDYEMITGKGGFLGTAWKPGLWNFSLLAATDSRGNRIQAPLVTTPALPTTTLPVANSNIILLRTGSKGHLFPEDAIKIAGANRMPLTAEQAAALGMGNGSTDGSNPWHASFIGNDGKIYWWRNGARIQALKSLRNGGIVKMQQGTNDGGIKSPAGIGYTSNASWRDAVFTPFLKGWILNKLKSNPEYFQTINKQQLAHRDLYRKASANGNNFRLNAYGKDTAVGNYQKWFESEGLNKLAIAPNATRYKHFSSKPNSTDNEAGGWVDGLYSGMTDDRRILGRASDWDAKSLEDFNKELTALGYTLTSDSTGDGNDGYLLLSKLNSRLQSPVVTTLKNLSNTNSKGGSNVGRFTGDGNNNGKLNEWARKLKPYLPSGFAIERLVQNRREANKVRDIMKAGIHPALESMLDEHQSTVGNTSKLLASYNAANQAAGNLSRQSLQMVNVADALQGMYQAEFGRASAKTNADLEYNTDVRKQALADSDLQLKVYEHNVGKRDSNFGKIGFADTTAKSYDAQAEFAKLHSNNAYSEGEEKRWRSALEKENATRESYLMLVALDLFNYDMSHLPTYTKRYEEFLRKPVPNPSDPKYADWKAELNELLKLYKLESGIVLDRYRMQLANIYGLKYIPIKRGFNYSDSDLATWEASLALKAADGTKLARARIRARSKDNDIFNTNIRHSNKRAQDAINGFSKTTLAALKKAMNL